MASLTCPIDLEPYDNEDDVVSTSCGHVFHRHCLLFWMRDHETCPQCRKEVNQRRIRRLYLTISEEQLQELQRELEEVRNRLEEASEDAANDLSHLAAVSLQLCDERDEVEKLEQLLRQKEDQLCDTEALLKEAEENVRLETEKHEETRREFDDYKLKHNQTGQKDTTNQATGYTRHNEQPPEGNQPTEDKVRRRSVRELRSVFQTDQTHCQRSVRELAARFETDK